MMAPVETRPSSGDFKDSDCLAMMPPLSAPGASIPLSKVIGHIANQVEKTRTRHIRSYVTLLPAKDSYIVVLEISRIIELT